MGKEKKYFVGGLINIGAGLAQAGYGAYQENLAKKKMAQADEAAQGPIRSLAARQRIARQESDTQSAIDSALRAQATAAEQLAAQGGSRALTAATPGLVRATELASNRAIDRFGQRNAAASQLADEQLISGQNIAAQSNLNRLARAADMARTQTLQGLSLVGSGIASTLGGLDLTKKTKAEAEDPTKAYKAPDIIGDNLKRIRKETEEGILDSLDKPQVSILEETPQIESTDDTELLDEVEVIDNKAEGGIQEPVEKTPGEFSHEENPIDIVQEGAKIGEMTGGEYIFNPEQAEEMRELSKEGDSELHKFIRNLLSKEQFK